MLLAPFSNNGVICLFALTETSHFIIGKIPLLGELPQEPSSSSLKSGAAAEAVLVDVVVLRESLEDLVLMLISASLQMNGEI